jgi:hypothetical protein
MDHDKIGGSARSGALIRDGSRTGIDDALAALEARKLEDAARRRTLAKDEYRLVKREPKEIAGAIALGMVLTRRGLRAADSWPLDGLLSGSMSDFMVRAGAIAEALPHLDLGAALVRIIDGSLAELQAAGMYAAWKRKAHAYFAEHRAWLDEDAALRLDGAWRAKEMTAGQQELIRATCAILQIDLPGHLLRGSAHDWIDANGASLRYRGIDE